LTNECIVVNSSVIIALAKVGLLNILSELYKEVIVPKAVYDEVVIRGQGKSGSQELERLIRLGQVKLFPPKDSGVIEMLHEFLGLGESEAIALALEKGCFVALDDRIARSRARSMKLKLIGTLGILRRAYDRELISKEALIQALKALRQSGFRISESIIKEIERKLK